MAGYLALRPYGDQTGSPSQEASAFASPMWLAAHLAGAAALVSWALAARGLGCGAGRLGRALTITAGVGIGLSLPYYGAETFGLHALGRSELAPEVVSQLASAIRNDPAALATFGAGLLAITASGVLLPLARRRVDAISWRWWPLGLLMATFLPQFYLPAPARVVWGAAFLGAAVLASAPARTRDSSSATQQAF